jgi:hypothetical protein
MSILWQKEAFAEINAARNALQAGLPGRARVAARRAAGIALVEYNHWDAFSMETQNYYDLLMAFSNQTDIPEEMHEVVRRLCQRVNDQHALPDHFDLVADAEKIIAFVAGQTTTLFNNGDKHGG